MSLRFTPSNKALHRTAFCIWGFALEFFLFISQFVAVGELCLQESIDLLVNNRLVNRERFLRTDGSILVCVVFGQEPVLKVFCERFCRRDEFVAGNHTIAIFVQAGQRQMIARPSGSPHLTKNLLLADAENLGERGRVRAQSLLFTFRSVTAEEFAAAAKF